MPYICDTLIYDPRVVRAAVSCAPMGYDTKFQHDHSYLLFSLFKHVYIISEIKFFYIINIKIKLFYYNKMKQNKYTIIEDFLVPNSVFTTIVIESIQLPTNYNLHSVLPLEIMQYLTFLFFYALKIQK